MSVQPPRLPPSEYVSKHTFSTWPPLPVDTGVPNGLLVLRNSLNDFVFEHRSGCFVTEPGYAGDIGAIEILLIDVLIICTKPKTTCRKIQYSLIFTDKNECVERDSLNIIIALVVKAGQHGIIESLNTSSATNWDLTSSLFFSGTVVTTIGKESY